MTIEELKKEKVQAMKDHDKHAVNALNLVINKIMLASIEKKAKGEQLCEGDINNIMQKAEKELIEECSGFEKAGRQENVANLQHQIETVRKYLPKLMSEQEIADIIKGLEDKSMPTVMKLFKQEYNGKCDMKVVGQVLKSLQ